MVADLPERDPEAAYMSGRSKRQARRDSNEAEPTLGEDEDEDGESEALEA